MIIKDHCLPGEWRNPNNWHPLCSWSENTVIQWGNPSGPTFFEVFPDNPDTIIHCKGNSLEDAEANAWKIFQRYVNCPNHEFERGTYTNGVGHCKHCGLFKSKAFEPIQYCCQCNDPNGYGLDNKDRWWCEVCYKDMPDELWPEWRIEAKGEDVFINGQELTETFKILSEEEFGKALEEVIRHLANQADLHGLSS